MIAQLAPQLPSPHIIDLPESALHLVEIIFSFATFDVHYWKCFYAATSNKDEEVYNFKK